MSKKLRTFSCFILLCFSSFGLLGNSLTDSTQLFLQNGNESYQKNLYDDALENYLKVVDLQYENYALYYNLGNVYFKKNENAKAILWYERALRLDPNNEDIKHNISFVQQKLIDKIEYLPEVLVVKWWNSISKFNTSNVWAVVSILACAVFVIGLLLYLLVRIKWIRSVSIFLCVMAFLVAIIAFVFAKKEAVRYINKPEAIVMSQVVNVKSTPNEKGSDLFVIHSGLKVTITDQLNEWIEIKLPNGEKGWLLSDYLEKI